MRIPALLPRLMVTGLIAISAVAGAQQRHNTDAPIDFGADNIELQDKANRAVLSGSVSVKQADMTLNSARMTVAYTGEVIGGSPYGATTVCGDDMSRTPTRADLAGARFQGRHIAELSRRLAQR